MSESTWDDYLEAGGTDGDEFVELADLMDTEQGALADQADDLAALADAAEEAGDTTTAAWLDQQAERLESSAEAMGEAEANTDTAASWTDWARQDVEYADGLDVEGLQHLENAEAALAEGDLAGAQWELGMADGSFELADDAMGSAESALGVADTYAELGADDLAMAVDDVSAVEADAAIYDASGGFDAGGGFEDAGGFDAGGGFEDAGGFDAGGGFEDAGGFDAGGGFEDAGGFGAGGGFDAGGYDDAGGSSEGLAVAGVRADAEWRLGCSSDEALARAHQALVGAGFTVSAPAAGRLHGERGSGLAMTRSAVPMTADAVVTATDGGCTVQLTLADRTSVGFVAGPARRNYEQQFAEIRRGLEAALGQSTAAPAATGSPVATPAAQVGPDGAAGASTLLTQAGQVLARGTEAAKAAVGQAFGGSAGLAQGGHWHRVQEIHLVTDTGVRAVSAAELQGMLAIADLVATQPGSLPANLSADLAAFAERMNRDLEAAGAAGMPSVRIDLSEAERPVVEFCRQQARLREALPLRTLHRCVDCGFEKVTNPDYQKLLDRNRKIQALTGAVGITMRAGAISPFLLVGTLFRLKRLDPDFVCPRCQGMTSDDGLATFCPSCRALRKEAVLRRCPQCEHDVRSVLDDETFWSPKPAGW